MLTDDASVPKDRVGSFCFSGSGEFGFDLLDLSFAGESLDGFLRVAEQFFESGLQARIVRNGLTTLLLQGLRELIGRAELP